jgi:GNAT superfamily N-acetyltransferase
MTMRHATQADIPAMVALGEQMHAESPYYRGLAWDGEKVAATIANLLAIPHGFARVVEGEGGQIVGGMLAMAVPHWCSQDLVACDLALFVAQNRRGGLAASRLLGEYRAWAADLGCKLVQFGVMTGVQVEQTVALCERLGWEKQGVVLCV